MQSSAKKSSLLVVTSLPVVLGHARWISDWHDLESALSNTELRDVVWPRTRASYDTPSKTFDALNEIHCPGLSGDWPVLTEDEQKDCRDSPLYTDYFFEPASPCDPNNDECNTDPKPVVVTQGGVLWSAWCETALHRGEYGYTLSKEEDGALEWRNRLTFVDNPSDSTPIPTNSDNTLRFVGSNTFGPDNFSMPKFDPHHDPPIQGGDAGEYLAGSHACRSAMFDKVKIPDNAPCNSEGGEPMQLAWIWGTAQGVKSVWTGITTIYVLCKEQCTSHVDCAGNEKGEFCNDETKTCVECMSGYEDCAGSDNGKHCDTVNGTCNECIDHTHCGDNFCDGTNKCVECAEDLPCAEGICVYGTCLEGCEQNSYRDGDFDCVRCPDGQEQHSNDESQCVCPGHLVPESGNPDSCICPGMRELQGDDQCECPFGYASNGDVDCEPKNACPEEASGGLRSSSTSSSVASSSEEDCGSTYIGHNAHECACPDPKDVTLTKCLRVRDPQGIYWINSDTQQVWPLADLWQCHPDTPHFFQEGLCCRQIDMSVYPDVVRCQTEDPPPTCLDTFANCESCEDEFCYECKEGFELGCDGDTTICTEPN